MRPANGRASGVRKNQWEQPPRRRGGAKRLGDSSGIAEGPDAAGAGDAACWGPLAKKGPEGDRPRGENRENQREERRRQSQKGTDQSGGSGQAPPPWGLSLPSWVIGIWAKACILECNPEEHSPSESPGSPLKKCPFLTPPPRQGGPNLNYLKINLSGSQVNWGVGREAAARWRPRRGPRGCSLRSVGMGPPGRPRAGRRAQLGPTREDAAARPGNRPRRAPGFPAARFLCSRSPGSHLPPRPGRPDNKLCRVPVLHPRGGHATLASTAWGENKHNVSLCCFGGRD